MTYSTFYSTFLRVLYMSRDKKICTRFVAFPLVIVGLCFATNTKSFSGWTSLPCPIQIWCFRGANISSPQWTSSSHLISSHQIQLKLKLINHMIIRSNNEELGSLFSYYNDVLTASKSMKSFTS